MGSTCTIDPDGHQNHVITYEVLVNDKANDDAWVVVQAVAAVLTTTYAHGTSTNANAFIQGIGPATQRDSPTDFQKWICPATWSTKPIGSSNGNTGSTPLDVYTSPINEPWKFSGSYLRGTRVLNIDRNGDLTFLAGTEEIKSGEIPFGNDTLHMEGHTATISLGTRAQAIFHCNETTIWGLTPRQLLLVAWNYDVVKYGNGLQAVHHSLDFEINYETWTDRLRNASFMQVNAFWDEENDDIVERLIAIRGADGHPVAEPHPIDESGFACDLADAPINEWERIPEFDFTTLFPTTLPGPFV